MKNGVTAYELMKLKRFNSKVRLVTPTIALDLKPITHITIQEAPDLYEWVTGGEFVLTTWFAFSLEPQLEAKAVDKLRGEISSRMKYTYESDNNTGNLFTIMAESGSIADFISRVEYASKIYQYDKEQVETYDATVKELSDMKKELKNEEASLNTQKSTLSVKQESLNKKISDLKAQKGNVDAELEQAKQEAARRKAVGMESAKEKYAGKNPSAADEKQAAESRTGAEPAAQAKSSQNQPPKRRSLAERANIGSLGGDDEITPQHKDSGNQE